jgi:hypothetical protein
MLIAVFLSCDKSLYILLCVVSAALAWDAWSRPSPDLPKQLRSKADAIKSASQDPNYEAHLKDFMKKGQEERPSYDLPSELRMLKYKNMAAVKRIAANELRSKNLSPALAEELDDLALEMEESHEHFVQVAKTFKTAFTEDYPDPSQ